MFNSKILTPLALIVLMCGLGHAQGVVAGNFNQYMSDAPASTSIGQASPIVRSGITDSPITLNIRGFPVVGPVALIFGVAANPGLVIEIRATMLFNMQIDVADRGTPGYGDQTLFNGFANLTGKTVTSANGEFSHVTMMPSCFPTGGPLPNCFPTPNFASFEVGSQAIVTDPTNGPHNVSSTPAILGQFASGYEEFNLAADESALFTFKQGFQFTYYGQSYTQAHVSANGFVSFGQIDNSFPNPTVDGVRTGVRRIMSFYNDLVPEQGNQAGGPAYPNTRIYAQQFKDANGLTKVKFVHDHVAEFSNQTGPHGGEIVITDNDDIAVFVSPYNSVPSINTVVGITPGNSVDPVVLGTGRDLSARYGTNWGPVALGKSIFELFNHGPSGTGVTNPIDLIGFANNLTHPVGPGIVFLKDPQAPNTSPAASRYIVQ